MENYKDYTEWELIEDEYFVRWVNSPDEYSDKFWKAYLVHNPEEIEKITIARTMIKGVRLKNEPKLTNEEYLEMFSEIQSSVNNEYSKVNKISFLQKNKWPSLIGIAATLTVFLVSVFVFLQTSNIDHDAVISEQVIKKSKSGSHITTVLTDGTKVRLNADSKITFPKSFDKNQRIVHLEGEAFFEVSRDESRPFIVISGSVETEVLGTSFNVRSYDTEQQIQVAVKDGRVKVRSAKNSHLVKFEHILSKDQASQLDIAENQVIKKQLRNNNSFAWIEWKLVFDEINLLDITTRLERWYGVEIKAEDGLDLESTYSGVFDNDPIGVVLEALKFEKAFDYRIENKKIILTKYKK